MTSKSPPIPPAQRSVRQDQHGEPGGPPTDRRDRTTGLQSGQPGDADANLKEQGRHGNIHQNTHHQGYQQDR